MSVLKQQGFGLLELLCAMVLSTLLMGSLIQVYLLMRHNQRIIHALNNFSQGELFIEQYLTQQLQNTTIVHCAPPNNSHGYLHAYSSDQLTAVLGSSALKHSDVLSVETCAWYRQRWQWVTIYYYLANSYRKDSLGYKIFGLYRKINHAPRQELLANIKQWHIDYGLIQNTAWRWVNNPGIANTHDIRLVQFTVLLVSPDYQLKHNSAYWFMAPQIASDRRYYRTMQFAVSVSHAE